MKMKIVVIILLIGLCILILPYLLINFLGNRAHNNSYNQKRASTTIDLNRFTPIDINNREEFLNKLMLSPYWKVEGNVAHARGIHLEESYSQETTDTLLFEYFQTSPSPIPTTAQIINAPLRNGAVDPPFYGYTVSIIFGKYTGNGGTECSFGGHCELGIYGTSFSEDSVALDGNSHSNLAIPLDEKNSIYLVISEQGVDPSRKQTADLLPRVMAEIERINNLDQSCNKTVYESFFKNIFGETNKSVGLKRIPGLQWRDTFYGYLKAQPGKSYDGINIKVTHDTYCGREKECTRRDSQIRGAEDLGRPYCEDDLVFFMLEDNATYTDSQYEDEFGIFSGGKTFKAKLQLIDKEENILHQEELEFKGWQR